MAKLASQVYGDALFELALEDNKLDDFVQETSVLRKVLIEDGQVSNFMAGASVERQDKEEFISSITKQFFSEEICGFMKLVLDKGRYSEMPAILDYFDDRVRKYKKIGVVTVATPIPLRDEQKELLQKKIIASSDYESLECTYTIDESLIGGMIIRMNDRVLDSSLRTQLKKLKGELKDLQVS